MRLPRFEYRRARSLEEASRLLTEADGRVCLAAGGTDLFPRLKYRLARPEVVVGLRGIAPEPPALSDSGELVIDALTPLADLAASPEVWSRAPALAEAALSVGSNQIRHMGTLGGNLCLETRCLYYNQSHAFQFIDPCLKRAGEVCYFAPKTDRCRAVFVADTPPVLMCLDAWVDVVGPEDSRSIAVSDLYTGDALEPVALETGEIISRVILPPASAGGIPSDQGTAYAKFSLRGGVEFAGTAVAACLEVGEGGSEGATCRRARVVVGAVEGGPARAREAEAQLEGENLTEEAVREVAGGISEEVRPIRHHGYSGAYLRHCLAVQAREALSRARARALGRAPAGPTAGGRA